MIVHRCRSRHADSERSLAQLIGLVTLCLAGAGCGTGSVEKTEDAEVSKPAMPTAVDRSDPGQRVDAEEADTPSRQVNIGSGALIFDAPRGFARISDEAARQQMGDRLGGRYYIWFNADQTASFVVELRPIPATQETLEALLRGIEANMEAGLDNIRWQAKEMREMDGRRWAVLDSTTTVGGKDVRSLLLMTDFKGVTLVFSFNAEAESWGSLQGVFGETIESIKVAVEVAP